MQPFQILMRVLYTLLSVYSFMVFVRIILSWFPIPQLVRVKEFLGRFVDPYLNQFRGITWLRFGMLDFSPVVGLILLNFIMQLTGRLAEASSITFGWVLSLLLTLIWSFISFMLNLLILLLVVRLVVSLINGGGQSSWGNVDSMIYNLMARIVGLFTNRSVSFHAGLLITIAVLFVLRLGGAFLIAWLLRLLALI